MGDSHVAETSGGEDGDKLCFQQSTSDSTSPEIDVPPGRFGQFDAEHDVGHLQAPARLEDTADLLDGQALLRYEIEHTVRNHDISAFRVDWQRCGFALPHLD
jgi:hypothetical protein